MSAAMASNTETVVVYVQLLGEGTIVYRPALGIPEGPKLVRLLEPDNYDADDEDWEFKPGVLVRVEHRQLSQEDVFVAVAVAE